MPKSPNHPTVPPFFLQLSEDEDHYYIAIDREQRERAKAIQGRVWDPEIRKWVYPRTRASFDAIRHAFSPFLEELTISPPENESDASPFASSPTAPRTSRVLPTSSLSGSASSKKAAPDPSSIGSMLQEQMRLTLRIQERLTHIEDSIAKMPPSGVVNNVSELNDSIQAMLAQLEQKLIRSTPTAGTERTTTDQVDVWLSQAIVLGTENDSVLRDICQHWNLVNEERSVIDDCEEKLKARLRDILDLPHGSKMSLNDLCNDMFEDQVIDKQQAKLLSAFRHHRNKLCHEPREAPAVRALRYLHALSALALVWPTLGKRPTHPADDDEEDNYNENSA